MRAISWRSYLWPSVSKPTNYTAVDDRVITVNAEGMVAMAPEASLDAISYIGKEISSYGLAEVLGQGGMSIVYRAVHKSIGKEVAIKVLQKAPTGDVLKRFLNEAVAAGSIRHPDIISIFDFGQLPDGGAFLIMELLQGETIAHRLQRRGKLDPLEAARFARQACGPLSAAHDVGIVHRDIKPQNLFIVRDVEVSGGERIKLLDFGVARLPTTGKGKDKDKVSDDANMLLGTLLYMAPEQLSPNSHVDERTDVYQLGSVLYHMVCGSPPFPNSQSLAKNIVEGTPEPPSRFAPIPAVIERAIVRCLAKDPSQRFQNIRELEDVLRTALSEKTSLELNSPTLVAHIPDLNRENLADNISRVRSAQTLVSSSVASGFFENAHLTASRIFPEGPEFFRQVQQTFEFYRNHLNEEYHQLTTQIDRTHKLWIGCVGGGFLVLIAAVVAVLMNHVTQGIIASSATTISYFIAKVFQQREDYYREQKDTKMKHLQYGNDWLLLIQSIEAIPGLEDRHEEQRRLARALLDKMKSRQSLEQPASKSAGKPASKPPGEPAGKLAGETASKPVSETASKPTSKPVSEPTSKPASKKNKKVLRTPRNG